MQKVSEGISPMTLDTSNGERRELQALARMGYGDNEFQVALFLLRRELDDLRRCGILQAIGARKP